MKIQYQSLAFVALAISAAANTSEWRQQPLNPEVFAKPFPVADQQFVAHTNFQVPTATTPQGFYPQPPDRFAKPFPASEQQFLALPPEHVPAPLDAEGVYAQPPDLFVKPFPASEQQFFTTGLQGNIPTVRQPDGWKGQQLEVRFAKPTPAAVQQYAAFQPLGFIVSYQPVWRAYELDYRFATPYPVGAQQFSAYFKFPPGSVPLGWWGQQLEYRFAKPVPVTEQSFTTAPEPEQFLPGFGWWGQQFEYCFKKPYPVTEQPFTSAPEPEQFLPGFGWYGYQFDYRFAKPFPVTAQLFSVWDLVGEVPPFLPPGAGKRRYFPSYIPQPPYEEKPNKPFRPVWDKPRGGEIEQHTPAAAPQGPPPLPPASLFGAAPTDPSAMPAGLPNFNQYAVPDPMGLAQRMRDVQDESDAMAVLAALGLLGKG